MPCFNSEDFDRLQRAFDLAVIALSPSDETLEEHIREIVAQAVMSASNDPTVSFDQVVAKAIHGGRKAINLERFLPTAA